MATRQEIIEVIDALLEGKITPEEARRWAGKEVWKTPHCAGERLRFAGERLKELKVKRRKKETHEKQ